MFSIPLLNAALITYKYVGVISQNPEIEGDYWSGLVRDSVLIQLHDDFTTMQAWDQFKQDHPEQQDPQFESLLLSIKSSELSDGVYDRYPLWMVDLARGYTLFDGSEDVDTEQVLVFADSYNEAQCVARRHIQTTGQVILHVARRSSAPIHTETSDAEF